MVYVGVKGGEADNDSVGEPTAIRSQRTRSATVDSAVEDDESLGSVR